MRKGGDVRFELAELLDVVHELWVRSAWDYETMPVFIYILELGPRI